MSPRFVGPQVEGAMRLHRERLREEARERQARSDAAQDPPPVEEVPKSTPPLDVVGRNQQAKEKAKVRKQRKRIRRGRVE